MQKSVTLYLSKFERFALNFKLDHALFWIVYASVYSVSFRWAESWLDGLLDSVILLSLHALVSYFNLYYLVPRYLFTKSYLSYLFTLILSIIFSVLYHTPEIAFSDCAFTRNEVKKKSKNSEEIRDTFFICFSFIQY